MEVIVKKSTCPENNLEKKSSTKISQGSHIVVRVSLSEVVLNGDKTQSGKILEK